MGVFGEETVTGMDGIDVADLGHADDPFDKQIALGRGCGSDADCLIREADRQTVFIGLGVSDDGFDSHFAACPDDAEGDLAAIGNQDFIEHSELRDRIGF